MGGRGRPCTVPVNVMAATSERSESSASNLSPSEGDRKKKLPIHAYRHELLEAVKGSLCVVITGETGCGKTTQLPQFLHEAGYTREGMIGVSQPRRVAAISVAHRVAYEMRATLGGEVGYQVRFDDHTSPTATRIKYMTDGCLLREFLDDPELSRYSVVVLDEAHERSLATDILFGLVQKLLSKPFSEMKVRSSPLKIVVMSATLDVRKFSEFFNSCPVFIIPGRTFPVGVHYCCPDDGFDLQKLSYMSQVSRVVMDIHLDHPEGDILVFLTGQAEIESICNRLFQVAEDIDYEHDVQCKGVHGLLILPLYGAMPTEQQQRVFSSVEEGIRRVIVATNIAATSLTIDGVVYVVDCGYVKQLAYNPRTGLDSLGVVPISQSEATQRTGRAGRTAPGKCFRLYSKKFYDQLDETTVPEIQRTSLTSVILSLKCMEIGNVLEFRYLDPPEERMILEALRQLYYFQAIDALGQVTSLGSQLIEFPLQPGLARALIRSKVLRCENALLPVISMLSVENVYIRPHAKKDMEKAMVAHRELSEAGGGTSDFSTLLAIYTLAAESGNVRRWCKEHYIHWRAVKTAQSVCKQLETILARQPVESAPNRHLRDPALSPLGQRVREALCYGLFGNVARVAPGGRGFRTMDGHSTTAYIHPSSTLFSSDASLDWILYYELVETAKTYMRTVCPIRYSWVKDLLPQLHDIDVYKLSECERKRTLSAGEEEEEETSPKKVKKDVSEDKGSREEAESLVVRAQSARERYLARKTVRQLQ